MSQNTIEIKLESLKKKFDGAKKRKFFLDFVIYAMLLASTQQLAETFGGDSWAWIKAISIEGAIAILAAGISEAKLAKQSTVMIWVVLIAVVIISIYANMNYEWMNYSGKLYVKMNNVKNTIDVLEHIRAGFVSAPLPVLIIGLSAVRSIYVVRIDKLETSLFKEEEKLETQLEKDRHRKSVKASELQNKKQQKVKVEKSVKKQQEKEVKPESEPEYIDSENDEDEDDDKSYQYISEEELRRDVYDGPDFKLPQK